MSMKYKNDFHLLSMLNAHLSPDTVCHYNNSYFFYIGQCIILLESKSIFFFLNWVFTLRGRDSCAHFGQHLRQEQYNSESEQQTAVETVHKCFWFTCSCKYQCYVTAPGWPWLDGHSIKAALSLSSSFGHRTENRMKGSWIEISTHRGHSAVSVIGKTDSTQGN